MEQIKYLSDKEEKILESFYEYLAANDALTEIESPTELKGYLFGIAITPDLIKPSEWLNGIFDTDTFAFDSEKQFHEIYSTIMGLYNSYLYSFNENKLKFPYKFTKKEAEENDSLFLELNKWLYGFYISLFLRQDIWGVSSVIQEENKSQEKNKSISIAFFLLSLIIKHYIKSIDEEISSEFADDEDLDDKELRELISNANNIVDSFIIYAKNMENLRRHKLMEEHPALYEQENKKNKIGRNDPCPCGSGKKYKKCCGLN